MITEDELKLVHDSLQFAIENGADACRVTYSRNTEDIISVLDGKIDKITATLDRSLTFYVYTNDRFGCFSTNKTDVASIKELVRNCIPMIGMLAEDPLRRLPDPERCCHNAVRGDELSLSDCIYSLQNSDSRIKRALSLSLKHSAKKEEFTILSEEGEYSDSLYESITVDSNGLDCRHSETSFDYWVEVTVKDAKGDKYSGYSWTSAPLLSSFDASDCANNALERAVSHIGSAPVKSGKYNMVVDCEVASKFVSPLLNALNGYYLQQHNSFLVDSLEKKIFPESLTILDSPHIKRESGSKLFDEEGVATKETAIIERGIVKTYFLNTYMSGKMNMPPTVEDAVRPFLLPWPEPGMDKDDIIEAIGTGIYVTDFNGGNFNSATGDFSYGIEGYYFKDGKIVKPVSEMLVTGNLLSLWSSFAVSGSDARRCSAKLIPTLAFYNVDFNGDN